MPFNIVSVPAKVVTINNTQMAIVQCQATQLTQLYGVEVQCKSGFSTNPHLKIYVFNNPKAAEDFISTTANLSDSEKFSLAAHGLRCDSNIPYDANYPGLYIVTAQEAEFPDNHVKESPIGIPGCEYAHDPKPFATKTKYQGFENDAFLTIVVTAESFPTVNDDDDESTEAIPEDLTITTIYIQA